MTPLLKKLIALAAVLLVVMVGMEQYRKLTRPKVPDFRGKTVKGETFDLAEHRGKRPVLISFYATWCGPCQMEVEHLTRFVKEYGDRGLQVVVVTAEPAKVIEAHPVMGKVPFPVVVDAQETFDDFKVGPIPHSFFLRPNGMVSDLEGYSDEAMKDLEKEVREALTVTSAQN